MTETVQVIQGEIDPDRSLKDSWNVFVAQMRSLGTDEEQIEAMRATYYMGAAQTFMIIDKAAGQGLPALAAAMRGIFHNIDKHMKDNMKILRTEGNA